MGVKTKTSFKKGITPETQFSTENQPTPEAKSNGKKVKKLIREIAGELLTGGAKENLKVLAVFLGLDIEQIDIETAMHLRQIEKAIKEGDTHAYNAVMDRLKGKAIQAITTEDKTVKATGFYLIEKPKD